MLLFFYKKMLNKEEFKKLIFNKYKIKKLIHSSGFASVYEGINVKENIPVALKLEKRKSKFIILESEAFLLMNLKGYGIPKIITYGHHGLYNVLIEELLGLSIGSIYDTIKSRKFNLKDICMIALQSLDRLEYIHSKLVIHRDIKPHNLVIGRNDPNIIYLIDFGLSRKYRSSRTGKHIKFNNLKLTYGSLRYLSINGNKGYEQSRRDDLESLGYMLVFLATGNIPWIKAERVNMDVVKKYILIYKIKKAISSEKLCQGLPEEMTKYINYCKELYFEQDPDYNYLKSLFYTILIKIKEKNDLKFCWISNRILRMNEKNNRSESKNKNNINKRSVSPHIRLLNKIKTSLQKTKSNSILNIEIKNKNNMQNSHLDKPLNIFYKDNDDNNNNDNNNNKDDNINNNNNNNNKINNNENEKEKEKEYSLPETVYKKNKKLKNNIESESTKEKDLLILNIDKSLSTSCDKKEKSKNKNKKKYFIFNNNVELEEKTIQNTQNNLEMHKNIQIFDDEENEIYEFKYKNIDSGENEQMYDEEFDQKKEMGKIYDMYNNIIDTSDKQVNKKTDKSNVDKNIKPLKIEQKTTQQQPYQKIKFISNKNFWDDDLPEINEDNNKYKTYNNVDLTHFDISAYNLDLINKNYELKYKKFNQNIEKNINKYNSNFGMNIPKNLNINLNNIRSYQVTNKNNNYHNKNLVKTPNETLNKGKLIQKQQKSKDPDIRRNIINNNTSYNNNSPINMINNPNKIKKIIHKNNNNNNNNNMNNNNFNKNSLYNKSISPFQNKSILINKKSKKLISPKNNQPKTNIYQNINPKLNLNNNNNLNTLSNSYNNNIINNLNTAKFKNNDDYLADIFK